MPQHTIYTATHGWFPQGNRTVKSFASGLVLIQQDFIAPTGTSDPPELGQPFPGDTTPCIDGAYIYPAPQFSDLGNGFTRCTVTAYGRSDSNLKHEYGSVRAGIPFIEISDNNGEEVQKIIQTFVAVAETAVSRTVLPKNSVVVTQYSGRELKIFRINGAEFISIDMTDIEKEIIFQRIDAINFGEFQEITCSYIVVGSFVRIVSE
jgi:hypothetical protein